MTSVPMSGSHVGTAEGFPDCQNICSLFLIRAGTCAPQPKRTQPQRRDHKQPSAGMSTRSPLLSRILSSDPLPGTKIAEKQLSSRSAHRLNQKPRPRASQYFCAVPYSSAQWDTARRHTSKRRSNPRVSVSALCRTPCTYKSIGTRPRAYFRFRDDRTPDTLPWISTQP